MNSVTVRKKLEKLNIRTDMISDDKLRNDVVALYNLIEELCVENEQLKTENQKLRDENAKLKGEQCKPVILPKKKSKNISSEDDRKDQEGHPDGKKSKEKKSEIKINRTEVCKVDKSILPADAEFKGYHSVTVQEIKIETDNVEYRKVVYY